MAEATGQESESQMHSVNFGSFVIKKRPCTVTLTETELTWTSERPKGTS